MKMNLEKAIILLVIGAFIVTSKNSLNALGDPITKEKAIEMSRNSELMREGLAIHAGGDVVEVNYYNSSMIERLKKWHSDEIFKNVSKDAFWEEKVPRGHTVWEVVWVIDYHVPGGYLIIVIVDIETGKIIHETTGVAFE